MSPQWYHAGENVPPAHYGPDNPQVTGVRWAEYTRGFALDDTTTNRLFDGAPPLNPFRNQPFLGAIIDQPRVNSTTARVGCTVSVTVGDPGGGLAVRKFTVGPGSPVSLALGQYASVSVQVVGRSTADGTRMSAPVRIQWVDKLPALPDAGLLRAPQTTFGAGANVLVPDGAIEVFFDSAGTVTFNNYAATNGAAAAAIDVPVVAGQTIRTIGQELAHNNGAQGIFFLAGL